MAIILTLKCVKTINFDLKLIDLKTLTIDFSIRARSLDHWFDGEAFINKK